MRIITQRELRNDNAAVMRDVEAGESFLVTKHGKPVARVVPAGAEELPVAKPAIRTGGFGRLARVRIEGTTTREVLDDLRGDR
ncbi:unannotated protein [freshwater metagenome]|uniref:Unannotated protein n=1 Tax=freshwater metagenome TaxID=449393 RepID=A0A6J6TA04_9ZZZZ|nr:type II toxin-antitoxin system prevent-host-death family antitoxin [Actinomycetota bacterium]